MADDEAPADAPPEEPQAAAEPEPPAAAAAPAEPPQPAGKPQPAAEFSLPAVTLAAALGDSPEVAALASKLLALCGGEPVTTLTAVADALARPKCVQAALGLATRLQL